MCGWSDGLLMRYATAEHTVCCFVYFVDTCGVASRSQLAAASSMLFVEYYALLGLFRC